MCSPVLDPDVEYSMLLSAFELTKMRSPSWFWHAELFEMRCNVEFPKLKCLSFVTPVELPIS